MRPGRSLSQHGDLLCRLLWRKGIVGEQDGIHPCACGEAQAEADDDRTGRDVSFHAKLCVSSEPPPFIGGTASR